MLGTKRTVPLWQSRRPRLLALERALAPGRKDGAKGHITADGIAHARNRDRLAAEARKLARFAER